MIRAELGGWSRDGLVRQSAFKGIDDGRDPVTVTRESPIASSVAEAEVGLELRDGEIDGETAAVQRIDVRCPLRHAARIGATRAGDGGRPA